MRKIIALFICAAAFSMAGHTAHAQTVSPTSISIPAIGVHASIIPVDVTAAYAIGVPPNFVQAGWYDRSALPGTGSTLIDGHVDNGASIPGVFKNLHLASAGDDIFLIAADGALLHYKVTSAAVYSRTAFPTSAILASANQPTLNIVTCYGTFLPKLRTYDRRLVVTAVLVS